MTDGTRSTEAEAREAMTEALAGVLGTEDAVDSEVREVLTPVELLEELMDVAWRHQFSDDRADARRKIKEIVGDRLAEVEG